MSHWSKSIEQLCCKVLRFNLNPLTVGQLLTLHKIDSPFIVERDEATLEDLSLSVLACILTPEEFDSYSRRIWFNWFLGFWGWSCGKMDWNKEAETFKNYLAENLDFSAVKTSNKKQSRKIYSPIAYRLLLTLIRNGHAESDVKKMSVWEATRRVLVILEDSESIELRFDDSDVINSLYGKKEEEVFNGSV